MREHSIDASYLQLALVARRAQRRGHATSTAKWCVMSAGVTVARRCSQHSTAGMPLRRPSLLQPMDRGNLQQLLERVRMLDGLDGVRRTWGAGLRTMRAELASFMLPEQAGAAQ